MLLKYSLGLLSFVVVDNTAKKACIKNIKYGDWRYIYLYKTYDLPRISINPETIL